MLRSARRCANGSPSAKLPSCLSTLQVALERLALFVDLMVTSRNGRSSEQPFADIAACSHGSSTF